MDRIFNRFSTVLQSAVDALAPPVPLLDDFVYHWKMLMRFYTNQKNVGIAKTSIESTNIPGHLDQLLRILLEEESSFDVANSPGPCLEYFLQHHLLDLLATLACTDCPPGMKHYTLNFVQRLITQTKQPILPHVGIYLPVQRLIGLCNGMVASPTEQTEIHFLCTLCALVCRDPHLTHIFNSSADVSVVDASSASSVAQSQDQNSSVDVDASDSASISNVTEAEPTHTVNSAASHGKDGSSSASTSNVIEAEPTHNSCASRDEDVINSASISTVAQSGDSTCVNTCADQADAIESASTSNVPETPSNRFPLLDALLSYLASADSRVVVKACEGVMVVASLPSDHLARAVAEQSDVSAALFARLEATFTAIPHDVDPNDLDDFNVKWGLDAPAWSEDTSFLGCREVALFLAWLDYCDQLVREAHPALGAVLAQALREHFMQRVLETALACDEPAPPGDNQHLVLATALVTKFLKHASAPALLTELFTWLVGDTSESKMCLQLIDNCCHDRDEVSLETLRLFEVLLDKMSSSVFYQLVLKYLNGRDYYDAEASSDVVASWSDEEDQRERIRGLDFSPGSSPVSRTLAPSNIHKIINSWLFLVPQQLRSSSDPEESGYQQYVRDADRQYRSCVARCGRFSWPLEAVARPDDAASSDSRAEADRSRNFDEGPFLRMLFSRMLRMPYQPYEINLQLTGLVSRLAMLPHGCLHEFLLDPTLATVDGAVTLVATLEAVAVELAAQIPLLGDYQQALSRTRIRLLGDQPDTDEESNGLLESLIVLEEFCKELAAIAFVKYHHSS